MTRILANSAVSVLIMKYYVFMCRISPFLVTRILANSPAGAVSIRHGFPRAQPGARHGLRRRCVTATGAPPHHC